MSKSVVSPTGRVEGGSRSEAQVHSNRLVDEPPPLLYLKKDKDKISDLIISYLILSYLYLISILSISYLSSARKLGWPLSSCSEVLARNLALGCVALTASTMVAQKRQKRQHNKPPFAYVAIDPESVGQDLPDPYAFLPKVDDLGLDARYTVELLRPGRGDGAPSPKTPGTPRGGGGVSSELREYKSLCEVLLPGLRTQSHLAQLIQRCPWSVSVVLREHGVVIGGTTFRVIRSQSPSVLLLDVLLLAVDPRPGVCGHGWGTRLVNYMKAVVLQLANREKAAAMMLCQADVAGGVANQFWARQRLRATPQAAEALRALHMWDSANDLYAHSIPMACWLQPGASVKAAESARAQESATVQYLLPFKSTRHTPSVRQHVWIGARLGAAAVGCSPAPWDATLRA